MLDPTLLIAADRQRALQAEARRWALARVAACCRPTALRRALLARQDRVRPVATCCA